MKELLAKLLDDDEDMLDLHLSAKAAEADARTSALQRMSMDASRPVTADGAAVSHSPLPPISMRLQFCAYAGRCAGSFYQGYLDTMLACFPPAVATAAQRFLRPQRSIRRARANPLSADMLAPAVSPS